MDARLLEAIGRLTIRERWRIAASRGMPMADAPDKVSAIADVTRALEQIPVRHALVGGVAVGIRSGVPRATVDTDIAVSSSVSRTAVIAALEGVGFDSHRILRA